MKLENMCWPQVKEYFKSKNTVVITVGSIENHGAHLCLGTDFLVADKLAEMVEEKVDVLFTPSMPFGNADHHMAFPGTITLGEEGLYIVIKSIVESLFAHGARRFVFLNGHGGNINGLQRVGAELNRKGGIAAILNWWMIAPMLNPAWVGGHASAQETSAIMAINENWVNLSALKEFKFNEVSENLPADSLSTVKFKGVSIPVPRSVDKVTEPGWCGPDSPNDASIKWGNEMLETVADFITDFIKEFEKAQI